jgi:DNA-binding NarL/FixJ family response regulator
MMFDNSICTTCPNRPLCDVLCPEAELYADQDQPKVGRPRVYEKPHLTPTEAKILSLLMQGKKASEIMQLLGISADSYYVHSHNLRKKA